VDVLEITRRVDPLESDGSSAEHASATDAGAAAPASAATSREIMWVSRAQDGDPVAFEHLVRAYQADVFRLCYRMLSDRGAAEDAVQDTFVTVWRRLPTLVDPQAFRSWIYHIGTRRCLNLIRTRTRRRTDVVDATDLERDSALTSPAALARTGGADDPATQVQAEATRRGLDEALAQLPADQRACWVLHEMHDLSYESIAYAIGVPQSTVRGRIARARRNLMEGMATWR
jgi:RNA polymerase sigma-70 factor (ECF subfamily)